jgi:hypothetical protein
MFQKKKNPSLWVYNCRNFSLIHRDTAVARGEGGENARLLRGSRTA